MRIKLNGTFKNILQFSIVMTLIVVVTHGTALIANASSLSNLLISTEAHEIIRGSQIPAPPLDLSGQEIIETAVLRALGYAKIMVGIVGLLYMIILGYVLITDSNSEESSTTARNGFIYSFIAFILVSMSEDIGRIFDMKDSTLLESPQEILRRVRLFDRQVEVALTFIKYTVGAYATVMMVRSGMKLITAAENEEERKTHMKSILYSAGGLVVILAADIFINKVFYKIDRSVYSGITGVNPSVDVKEGVEQIAGITNFIVGLIGPIAVLMVVLAAIQYATAGGDEEKMAKAKRMMITIAIGIILMYGAFGLVSTIIAGRLVGIGALT